MTESTPTSDTTKDATPADTAPPPAVVPRPKQTRTPKQLAALAKARNMASANAAARRSGQIARNQDSANELVKRIEESDHQASSSRGSGERSTKRKKTGKRKWVGSSSSFVVGGLALGGIALMAYQTKKKGPGLNLSGASQTTPTTPTTNATTNSTNVPGPQPRPIGNMGPSVFMSS